MKVSEGSLAQIKVTSDECSEIDMELRYQLAPVKQSIPPRGLGSAGCAYRRGWDG